jgi:hypothetical protein
MNQQAWRKLCAVSVGVILFVSTVGGALEPHVPAPLRAPLLSLGLIVLGIAFIAFFASVPPLAIRWFIERQQRTGNAAHPAVAFLAQNEEKVVRAVWIVWILGTAITVPAAVHDWMMHR